MNEIKVADEVWISVALLHREHPEREAFLEREIRDRIDREGLYRPRRPGVVTHISQHCVANKEANPGAYRMLYETAYGQRRLFRRTDEAHPSRAGKITPRREDIPEKYRPLLDWYYHDYDPGMRELTFTVEGLPPSKGEALSMFNASHSHSSRVTQLLVAARDAIRPDFQPFPGPIGLEVLLHAPIGVDPWDATNYLGGIADTLQDKSHLTIPLDHLGGLTQVELYKNDRQIREIHYRQEESPISAYRIRIWTLLKNSQGGSA